MSYRDSYFVDKNGRFGQVNHPFRVRRGGLIGTMFATLFKSILAMFTFGFIPLAALTFGVHFVPNDWKLTYFVVMGSVVLTSIPLSWSFRNEACFDQQTEQFVLTASLLGRSFRSWNWPINLFAGITYGTSGTSHSGAVDAVRLKCIIDGYLVDSFMLGNSKHEAKNIAIRLSEVSGLPILGEESTGSQHALNDLRRHAWLVQKYGKK